MDDYKIEVKYFFFLCFVLHLFITFNNLKLVIIQSVGSILKHDSKQGGGQIDKIASHGKESLTPWQMRT